MASYKRKDLSAYFGSEFLIETVCKQCHVIGLPGKVITVCTSCGDHFCNNCFSVHINECCPKHTSVNTNDNVTAEKKISLTTNLKQSVKKSFSFRKSSTYSKDRCHDHPEKAIKYYCQKHDNLGCSICITLGHKLCEDTELIVDVSKDITKTDMYIEFNRRLTQVVSSSNDALKDVQKNISEIHGYNVTATKVMENFRQQINDILDEMAINLNTTLKEIYDEELKDMDKIASALEEINSEGKLLLHQLKSLTFEKQNSSAYIKMRKSKQHLETLESELHKAGEKVLLEKKPSSYIFTPNYEIIEGLKKFSKLGEVAFMDKGITASPIKDIVIKPDNETYDCWITGMTFLTDDKIVAADRNNRNIKLINVLKEEVEAVTELAAKPWDITKVNESRVIVSMPNKKRLAFIDIDHHQELKVGRELTVKEPCYGVAYICRNNTIAVSYAGNHKLEVIDLDGIIIKIIQCNETGIPLFQTPCHIAVDQDSALLYVSNSGNSALHCMTQDGSTVSSYTNHNLKHLRQVTIDKNGQVFVCGAPNNILHVNPQTKKIQKLIADPKDEFQAFSIAYNKVSKMIYIGMENLNTLKVFHVNPTNNKISKENELKPVERI